MTSWFRWVSSTHLCTGTSLFLRFSERAKHIRWIPCVARSADVWCTCVLGYRSVIRRPKVLFLSVIEPSRERSVAGNSSFLSFIETTEWKATLGSTVKPTGVEREHYWLLVRRNLFAESRVMCIQSATSALKLPRRVQKERGSEEFLVAP
jgi:hypothetical protein